MNLIKEIEIEGFDKENIPVIRVFENNQSYLIFEEFPPENGKLTEEQIANFDRILSNFIGVKVIHDDRELFIVFSNKSEIINKIIYFFNSL